MNTNYEPRMNYVKGLSRETRFHLANYNINPAFPDNIANIREEDLTVEEAEHRKDFRGERAFTIDCEDCKDMDDAVSIVRTNSGYRLAVHIADVSAYVSPGSELFQIAAQRATSIYLPNETIPMLPKVLSNNCCSLNPGVTRNTLSVIMHVNKEGEVIKSEIVKGMIKSRVKGIYSEINKLLAGDKNVDLMKKYNAVYDDLFIMAELYEILKTARERNGANTEDSNKPKIAVKKNQILLIPMEEGVAENLIEEYMILTNKVIAEFLVTNDLPGIFRIQEAKNNLAAYSPFKYKHCELALESYSHFTSPIRRLADLVVHQILTMHLRGCSVDEIHQLFDETLPEICDIATRKSRTAKHVEEQCEHYCYRSYFRMHSNDTYTGKIVCFDKRHRPIVRIDRYNIKIVGDIMWGGAIGDAYYFHVGVSDRDRKLFASRARMMTVLESA